MKNVIQLALKWLFFPEKSPYGWGFAPRPPWPLKITIRPPDYDALELRQ